MLVENVTNLRLKNLAAGSFSKVDFNVIINLIINKKTKYVYIENKFKFEIFFVHIAKLVSHL